MSFVKQETFYGELTGLHFNDQVLAIDTDSHTPSIFGSVNPESGELNTELLHLDHGAQYLLIPEKPSPTTNPNCMITGIKGTFSSSGTWENVTLILRDGDKQWEAELPPNSSMAVQFRQGDSIFHL